MARSNKHAPRSIVLDQKIKLKVTPARFTTLDSLDHLDIARLSGLASATFEVGYFEGGCCRRMVHAVVKKGKVTKLEIEPCEGSVPMTPELEQLMHAAWKKVAASGKPSNSLPLPVSSFLARAMGITIEIFGCFYICGFGYCLLCCINTGPLPEPKTGCQILRDPHKKPQP